MSECFHHEDDVPDEWKALYHGIADVDIENVQALLLNHPNKEAFINWKRPKDSKPNSGLTLLQWAISAERWDIVKLLMENGADPNATDSNGTDALILVSDHEQQTRLVELLLAKGADPNSRDSNANTPLGVASSSGNVAIVEILLENGADPHMQVSTNENEYGSSTSISLIDGDDVNVAPPPSFDFLAWMSRSGKGGKGKACLIGASGGGHVAAVEMLLKKGGVDPNFQDVVTGNTGLIEASREGQAAVVKILLHRGADVTICKKNGDTPLISACISGNSEIIDDLLKHGADYNVANKNGETPFLAACKFGHINIVTKWMDDHGVDPTIATDRIGSNAAHIVCTENHADILKLLLERHVDPKARNINGDTPLMLASKNGHGACVQILLDYHVDPNVFDESNDPPLELAYRGGHTDTLKILLEHGANPNIRDKHGFTLLHRACTKVQTSSVDRWIETGTYGYFDIPWSTSSSTKTDDPTVELLLKYGADPNVSCAGGDEATPLIRASSRGHDNIATLLLQHGGDPNKQGSNGNTPLLSACRRNNAKIVGKLLEKGADPNAKNMKGDSPLIIASMQRCDETVALLLAHGAQPNVQDSMGRSPIIHAAKHGHDASVALLLQGGGNILMKDKWGKSALDFILSSDLEESWRWAFRNKDAVNGNAELPIGGWWNAVDQLGRTHLHKAALENNEVKAKKMLEIGTDIDKTDEEGHTPLFHTAEKGFVAVAKLLMDYGADVNKTDERGYVAGCSSIKYAALFNDALPGSDYETCDASSRYSVKDGRTPLFVAAQNGHQEIVAMLLSHGADPYLCNSESQIPSEISVVHGPIQQLLKIQDYLDRQVKGDKFEEKYRTCKVSRRGHPSQRKKNAAPQLDEIIHDLVKYPQYTEHFLELYQENADIVNWLDKDGRTVRQVACKECRDVTLFMGRFDLEDRPKYESPTCKIYNALDYGTSQSSNAAAPKRVVMKFIEKEEHFVNEMQARRNSDGSSRFSYDYVTPDVQCYQAEIDEKYALACMKWKLIGPDEKSLPGYCIVMECGERSLLEAINAENLSAEHKDLQRREILLTLCHIFGHIHGKGYIHGDIKPHNVMRHAGAKISWKAIDFDSCTKTGEFAGLKLTTGSAPPEMLIKVERNQGRLKSVTSREIIPGPPSPAGLERKMSAAKKSGAQVVLRQPGVGMDDSDLVLADPSFDVWSYGILMYQLVTGRTFFHCDIQGNLDNEGLKELFNLTQSEIHEKLEIVEDVNAHVLLSRILRLDPLERPTMLEIEKDHYFHPSETPQGRKGNDLRVSSDSFTKIANMSERSSWTASERSSRTFQRSIQISPTSDTIEEFCEFAAINPDFSFYKLRDEDKDLCDILLHSEIEVFNFEKLGAMGEKPKFINGDTIYSNTKLRDLLCKKGPDYFLGCLVEYFELYNIMNDAHEVCHGIQANLVSDVKSLKGTFSKLFVRGKELNDVVRGTLFCNSLDHFIHVGRKLKESYGYNVFMKSPKREVGAWPIPKLLVYGNRRINGRCMSVEIQFSTVYLHLVKQASNNHFVYESMRESTGYLDRKDECFHDFLQSLNKKYVDTEGFLQNDGEDDVGRFEIQLREDGTHCSSYTSLPDENNACSTGFLLDGLVRCRDRMFRETPMHEFGESSFVVNKHLTLLSSHSFWSGEAYDLEGKTVEFVVSFKGRGLVIAGIGTLQCYHGELGMGERCSVHLGRSKLLVRKNGVEQAFREQKLPNQMRSRISFRLKHGTLVVSFVGLDRKGGTVKQSFEVSMPSGESYYLYMRAPPGVHDVKFHDVDIREDNLREPFPLKTFAYPLVAAVLLPLGWSLLKRDSKYIS